MRLAIGIATRGRAAILAETLAELDRQTRRPDRVIVCHVTPEDIGAARPGVDYILSPAGLPRQRNAILDAAADCDLLLFLDDDFLPAPDYCAVTEAVIAARPDCVVTTGTVLADGANAPGYSPAEGRAILAQDRYAGDPLAAAPHFNGYGCNMAMRLDVCASMASEWTRRCRSMPGTRISTSPAWSAGMARSCGWPAPAACISAPSWGERRAGGSAIRRWRTRSTWRARGPIPGRMPCPACCAIR